MAQAIGLKIDTKKIVYRGQKFYEVKGYSCYESERLPVKYFEQFPYCFNADDNFLAVVSSNNDDDCYEVRVGDLIPQEDFERMLKIVRHCGEKLHKINMEIKEIKKGWNGQESFEI